MTKGYHRLFLIAAFCLAAAFLLFSTSTAFATSYPLQITNNPANEGRPDVHGNIIVWKGNQNGNYDVYMYNMLTGVTQTVTDNPSIQNLPITNGSVVVWQDYRSGDNDVYIRNIIGGPEQPLVTGPGNQGIGAIDGNTVVYVDDSSGTNDIYAINILTREITPVCVNPANQWEPRISGNRVVWEDNRDGNYNIYMKDMSTGVESQVSTLPGDDRVPDISGNTVVWQAHHDGKYDIWMKNLATGAEEPVTTDGAYKTSPRVSGDLVVWQDYRNDANPADTYYDYDIYKKDLASGVESILAGGNPIQAEPAVDGESVVWADTSSRVSYDIWLTKVLDLTAPVISGLSPADQAEPGCSSPLISASYTDNRTGVDTGSVHLELDGADVTSDAAISETGVSYQPQSLEDGPHSVYLSLTDGAGNQSTSTWQFTTSRPVLAVASSGAFWSSYSDYASRELSVQYRITNISSADAMGLQILESLATSGVMVTSQLPLEVGEIQPGSHTDILVRYLIPPAVPGFKTTMYSVCSDTSGSSFYFPGPPPV